MKLPELQEQIESFRDKIEGTMLRVFLDDHQIHKLVKAVTHQEGVHEMDTLIGRSREWCRTQLQRQSMLPTGGTMKRRSMRKDSTHLEQRQPHR